MDSQIIEEDEGLGSAHLVSEIVKEIEKAFVIIKLARVIISQLSSLIKMGIKLMF